jgi:hypothetical protein
MQSYRQGKKVGNAIHIEGKWQKNAIICFRGIGGHYNPYRSQGNMRNAITWLRKMAEKCNHKVDGKWRERQIAWWEMAGNDPRKRNVEKSNNMV